MNTTAEIRGANVHVDNNGGVGILVVGDSRLAFSGFDVSRGSSLSTSFNKGPGMLLDHGLLATPGSSLPPGDWVITSSGNGGPGFLLASNGSIESPFGTARFVVEANPVGIQLGQGSTAVIVGGLNVKNNTQAGVVAEDASLTLGFDSAERFRDSGKWDSRSRSHVRSALDHRRRPDGYHAVRRDGVEPRYARLSLGRLFSESGIV